MLQQVDGLTLGERGQGRDIWGELGCWGVLETAVLSFS